MRQEHLPGGVVCHTDLTDDSLGQEDLPGCVMVHGNAVSQKDKSDDTWARKT